MEQIIDKLVYLDREFISSLYEQSTGATPEAVITRTEGLNAGVQIPLFSAKASSIESKSYSISSFQMFSKLGSELERYPLFEATDFDFEKSSVTCWIVGMLSATTLEVSRHSSTITIVGKPKKHKTPKKKIVSEEEFWELKAESESKFALVTSNEYFASGVEQFSGLVGTVIAQIVFPVKVLARITAVP